jgi:hypothetical protein
MRKPCAGGEVVKGPDGGRGGRRSVRRRAQRHGVGRHAARRHACASSARRHARPGTRPASAAGTATRPPGVVCMRATVPACAPPGKGHHDPSHEEDERNAVQRPHRERTQATRGRTLVTQGRTVVPRSRAVVPRGRALVGRGRAVVTRGRTLVPRSRAVVTASDSGRQSPLPGCPACSCPTAVGRQPGSGRRPTRSGSRSSQGPHRPAPSGEGPTRRGGRARHREQSPG